MPYVLILARGFVGSNSTENSNPYRIFKTKSYFLTTLGRCIRSSNIPRYCILFLLGVRVSIKFSSSNNRLSWTKWFEQINYYVGLLDCWTMFVGCLWLFSYTERLALKWDTWQIKASTVNIVFGIERKRIFYKYGGYTVASSFAFWYLITFSMKIQFFTKFNNCNLKREAGYYIYIYFWICLYQVKIITCGLFNCFWFLELKTNFTSRYTKHIT